MFFTRAKSPITHIIAGLGNPGSKYEFTRHNAGFLALDYIAGRLNCDVRKLKFQSLCGEATVRDCRGEPVRALLLKPQTFMNNSGEALRDALGFYKLPPERLIVIYDDVNFEPGRVRIRADGSDGGHNGMKSIIYQLRSDAFPRVRIGVGAKPHPDYDLAAWVTGRFPEADQKLVFAVFGKIYDALPLLLGGDMQGAMSLINN